MDSSINNKLSNFLKWTHILFAATSLTATAQETATISLPKCMTEHLTPQQVAKAEADIKSFAKAFTADENHIYHDAEFAADTFAISYLHKLMPKESALDMRSSANAEADAWDILLNKYYKRLMAGLDSDEKKNLLKTAQRAWLAFREADDEYVLRNMPMGSMYLLEFAVAGIERLKARVIELHNYLIMNNER